MVYDWLIKYSYKEEHIFEEKISLRVLMLLYGTCLFICLCLYVYLCAKQWIASFYGTDKAWAV